MPENCFAIEFTIKRIDIAQPYILDQDTDIFKFEALSAEIKVFTDDIANLGQY